MKIKLEKQGCDGGHDDWWEEESTAEVEVEVPDAIIGDWRFCRLRLNKDDEKPK